MTRAELFAERPAVREWRGLPHGRCLDAGDLSWFTKPFSWWKRQAQKPVYSAALTEAMRDAYIKCSRGGNTPPGNIMID